MKEHPIIMSAESIRAMPVKRQTRRPIKPQPGWNTYRRLWAWEKLANVFGTTLALAREIQPLCPYGQPGDKLRVRETFALHPTATEMGHPIVFYKARGDSILPPNKWHPSIFMPRWASRFVLPLTIVRAERLWDITEEDAIAEGFGDTVVAEHFDLGYEERPIAYLRRSMFVSRWQSLNAKRGYPWDSNPWVWVLGWEQVEGRE